MELTKGTPEPTEPDWSTGEREREGKKKVEKAKDKNVKNQRTSRIKTRKNSQNHSHQKKEAQQEAKLE